MTADRRPLRHSVRNPARLGLPAIAVVALLVTACHPAIGRATHSISDRWSGGYTAALRLTNTGAAELRDWELTFVLPDDVAGVWNAELVGRTPADEGWRYTLAPPTWQRALSAGASIDIGWSAATATAEGEPAIPTHCSLDGLPIHCVATPASSSSSTTTTEPPTTSAPSTTVASSTTTSTPAATSPEAGGARFAPYLDTTLWPPPDLDGLAAARGVDELTLAFVVTGQAPCAPAWGGVIPLADDHLGGEVDQLRAAGGDVIVSFGGASGVELAQSCTTVDDLAAAYAAVVAHYDLDRIDLDIEGGALADTTANERRAAALARVQADAYAAGRTLEVSLTLPVLPTGLTPEGLEVVRTTIDADVDITTVNIMAMDYGPAAAPDPDGRMGRYAIDAATAVHAQLGEVLPGSDAAQRWAMVGVTPMIGQNDVAGEVFLQTDAAELAAFAGQVDLGLLSMWSLTRDVPCPDGPSPWASPVCSGIEQSPGDFASILGG